MKLAALRASVLSLTALAAYGSQQPSQTGEQNKTQPPAKQQKTPDATPQEGPEFKMLYITNGGNEAGKTWTGKTYETSTHTKVQLIIVHLDSPESAKKEYDDNLKNAIRILNQGKVQDRPATRPATTEDRAEIVVPGIRECKEVTAIIATAGRSVRIIQSCSVEAALQFEKEARRGEREDDHDVVRKATNRRSSLDRRADQITGFWHELSA